MRTQFQNNSEADRNDINKSGPKQIASALELSKVEWLRVYSHRLLKSWLRWQTPLGIAPAYTKQIEKDLTRFYDDPLKRMFIETTYC